MTDGSKTDLEMGSSQPEHYLSQVGFNVMIFSTKGVLFAFVDVQKYSIDCVYTFTCFNMRNMKI